MGNMFKKATAIKSEAPQNKSKAKRREVKMKSIETFATLDALAKAIETLKGTVEAEIKAEMKIDFTSQVHAMHVKPTSFRGVENNASASCEFRKRTSRSILQPAEIETLKAKKVTIGKQVLKEQFYLLNPKYNNDEAIQEKISAALVGLPEDLFLQQEELSVPIVTEETINDAVKDSVVFKDVIDIIGSLAIKPKVDTTDVKVLFDRVAAMLKVTAIEEEVADA
jgi:hypothetical protein